MPDPSKPTIKQKREASRTEKVEAMKKKMAVERRNRRIAIIASIVGAVAVIGLIVAVVIAGSTPRVNPEDIVVDGITEFDTVGGVHVDPAPVDYAATYDMTPPAGGDHSATWLNCGIYDQPQVNENAVHSLEHGAVWITYDPDAVSDQDVATLRDALPSTYSILSPFPGLPTPMVVSAWNAQLQLDGADDPQLKSFIDKYWQSPEGPEPGAACTGGIDGPGLVS